MQLTFKLCFSTTTVTYDIPGHLKMDDFYRTTITKLRTDMNIGNNVRFYIIQGMGSKCVDEDPPMLLDDKITVDKYFKTNYTTLYVRVCD